MLVNRLEPSMVSVSDPSGYESSDEYRQGAVVPTSEREVEELEGYHETASHYQQS